MKRYLYNEEFSNMPIETYDVVIVGTGMAGLYAALNISEDRSCALISKSKIDTSNSWLAQGGIAAVVSDEDEYSSHYDDTLVTGVRLCKEEAVKILVEEGPKDIQSLIDYSVPFDLDDEGELRITKEGGHSKRRVVHCGGDATGRESIKALGKIVAQKENITIKDQSFLIDIITNENTAKGVIVIENNETKLIQGKDIILATGGIGQVFKSTTNPIEATGDGIASAIRAGAKVKDMEFIQFHPTALYLKNRVGKSFLISEAVRGEGGILRNASGEAFMEKQHPMKDLAPRDIVTRAIAREMSKDQSECVYLDFTHQNETYIKERFPTIYNHCLDNGINMAKDLIPVRPVQHYVMGGIITDVNGKTNIKGLYAIGEVACTGVHGANRLASNSLLECLVFGRRCARAINENKDETDDYLLLNMKKQSDTSGIIIDWEQFSINIKKIMNEKGSIIRNKKNLEEGIEKIEDILNICHQVNIDSKEAIETYNLAIIAKEVLKAAHNRRISVGAHYREDGEYKEDTMQALNSSDELIKAALMEDVGTGDITSISTVPKKQLINGKFIAKEPGVLCGLDIMQRVYKMVDERVKLNILQEDGNQIKEGDVIAEIWGPARSILVGERTALNFMQRMSGIATKTSELVKVIEGTQAKITDTRKTVPGLRVLDKYAVKVGGGTNHRFNLADGVLIKDNHISAAGGITQAIKAAKEQIPHTLKIEVEVETFEEIEEAVLAGADIIMLDNMTIDEMAQAVEVINQKALVEASGNMGDKDLLAVAKTGVDIISVGALTHSVKAFDISLKFDKI